MTSIAKTNLPGGLKFDDRLKLAPENIREGVTINKITGVLIDRDSAVHGRVTTRADSPDSDGVAYKTFATYSRMPKALTLYSDEVYTEYSYSTYVGGARSAHAGIEIYQPSTQVRVTLFSTEHIVNYLPSSEGSNRYKVGISVIINPERGISMWIHEAHNGDIVVGNSSAGIPGGAGVDVNAPIELRCFARRATSGGNTELTSYITPNNLYYYLL